MPRVQIPTDIPNVIGLDTSAAPKIPPAIIIKFPETEKKACLCEILCLKILYISQTKSIPPRAADNEIPTIDITGFIAYKDALPITD